MVFQNLPFELLHLCTWQTFHRAKLGEKRAETRLDWQ